MHTRFVDLMQPYCPIIRFDYNTTHKNYLSIQKGQRLEILMANENGWWMAKCVRTRKEGFVPANYLIQEQKKIDDKYLSPSNNDQITKDMVQTRISFF